jgi:predicted enzyme related to lactoylglutathione lyase
MRTSLVFLMGVLIGSIVAPGHGDDGPTLEVFNYSQLADGPAQAVNRPGFAHIAFSVESVHDARAIVLANGGGSIGEVVTMAIASGGRVTWCYVTDPEGNIIELQSWE